MQRRLRKAAAVVTFAAMLVGTGTRRASAQNSPPDLRMLMNLDLFEPRSNGVQPSAAPAAAPTDDSLLDQIQTLDHMGYLGHPAAASASAAPAPRPAGGSAAEPETAPEPAPAPPDAQDAAPRSQQSLTLPRLPQSAPTDDVEGPLP